MKKKILFALLVIVAIAAGVVFARLHKPALYITPHTIVYRATFYDEAGKIESSSVVIRRVSSDGKWKHTQIKDDGKIVTTSGEIKNLLTLRSVEAGMPEHLHVKYIESKNNDAETWLSPELQDYLKLVSFHASGSKMVTLEAVDVSTP